jgi:hypothetical protein
MTSHMEPTDRSCGLRSANPPYGLITILVERTRRNGPSIQSARMGRFGQRDNECVAVTCLACSLVHMVNFKTGKLLASPGS